MMRDVIAITATQRTVWEAPPGESAAVLATPSEARACGRRSPRSRGGAGSSTSLVGTYEQVAQGLLEYVDLGASTLLIRGLDVVEDARKYARAIELVRAVSAHRPALAG